MYQTEWINLTLKIQDIGKLDLEELNKFSIPIKMNGNLED